jgi:hypothetical protein
LILQHVAERREQADAGDGHERGDDDVLAHALAALPVNGSSANHRRLLAMDQLW